MLLYQLLYDNQLPWLIYSKMNSITIIIAIQARIPLAIKTLFLYHGTIVAEDYSFISSE